MRLSSYGDRKTDFGNGLLNRAWDASFGKHPDVFKAKNLFAGFVLRGSVVDACSTIPMRASKLSTRATRREMI
jgi:hypothetical protein